MKDRSLLIVGNPAIFHVGAHLKNAGQNLGLNVEILDLSEAFAAPALLARFNWWMRGHRPAHLTIFSEKVLQVCRTRKPAWLLGTGIAPLSREALVKVGKMGVQRLNYLTDDPWNPAHRAPWFMEGLAEYDRVFSPRQANLGDLREHGCQQVHHLPFAYAPEVHFVEQPVAKERDQYNADVLFAGGADKDRMPWIKALVSAGFDVALYGGYWERCSVTKPHSRGHADMRTLRKATASAKVTLGLVRKANRDGHAMRSFEVPAMGGCLLSEQTKEHLDLFGPEGDAMLYFKDSKEMVRKIQWLLERPAERQRLARAAHDLITQGANTYADRLRSMLKQEWSAEKL
jgi:spore maturation protein CgeB